MKKEKLSWKLISIFCAFASILTTFALSCGQSGDSQKIRTTSERASVLFRGDGDFDDNHKIQLLTYSDAPDPFSPDGDGDMEIDRN